MTSSETPPPALLARRLVSEIADPLAAACGAWLAASGAVLGYCAASKAALAIWWLS